MVVHRKAEYGKITNFNAVTFSAGKSEFIKDSISCEIVSKNFWTHYIMFSYVCKNGFHMSRCYSLIGHDIENNPPQKPYGH